MSERVQRGRVQRREGVCPACTTQPKAPGRGYCQGCIAAKQRERRGHVKRAKNPVPAVLDPEPVSRVLRREKRAPATPQAPVDAIQAALAALPQRADRPFRPVPKPGGEQHGSKQVAAQRLLRCRACGGRFLGTREWLCGGCRL
jgi:hypothetical protein